MGTLQVGLPRRTFQSEKDTADQACVARLIRPNPLP